MKLREVTRTVIGLVEKTSGCPVAVSEDASLKTLAVSRIARGANRIHAITYNPTAVSEPDYLITKVTQPTAPFPENNRVPSE